MRDLIEAAFLSDHGQQVLGIACGVGVVWGWRVLVRRRDDARAARAALRARQRMAMEVLRPISCSLCHGLSPRLIGVPIADDEMAWVCDDCHPVLDPHGIAPEL